MCFNKDVSILSYLIGFAGCILLYYRDYKIEGLFYLFIIQMQLIEYLLWLNNSCNLINKTITKIGIVLNHIQPIILYFLIIYFNSNVDKYTKIIIHLIIIIYIISTIAYLIYNYKLLDSCTIGIENKKELFWEIQHGHLFEYYHIFVFAIFFMVLLGFKKHNYLNAYIILASIIISYIVYDKNKAVGTIWCLFAAYIPLLLNIVYTIK